MAQQEQQEERLIGEEGLDLNDHAAVSRWVADRLEQHRQSEQQYRQQFIDQGIDPDLKPADDAIDLSGMPEQVRKMVADGLKEYEQMEAEFRQRLATARPRTGKGGNLGRWTKL